jgi:LysR family transcriptional regulator, glycine cleavage system transcriptional activator
MSRIPLHELEAFAAVLLSGGFKAAAQRLNLTVSAISHRLRTLEQRVGAPLFERRHARAVPTPFAATLAEDTLEGFRRLERVVERALDPQLAQLVAIHATPTIAGLWLTPRLGAILRAFPNIDIRVTATFRPVDPGTDPVDFSLRYGQRDWPGLEARPLMREPIVPLAAPALLAALGRPLRLDDLRTLPLIRSEVNLVGWEDFLAACGVGWQPSARSLGFDRSLMAIEAAASGLGVALDSAVMAAVYVADGRLVVPLVPPGGHLSAEGHHLVVPAGRALKPLADAVAAWLVDAARASEVEAWAFLARPSESAALASGKT